LFAAAMTCSSDAQQTMDLLSAFNIGSIAVNAVPEFDPSFTNVENTVFSTVSISAADIASTNNGAIIDSFFMIEGLPHTHFSDLTILSVT